MSDETTPAEESVTELVIDDATRDTTVGGNELIPVSDAGAPKAMTTGQIKDYVIAQIAAIAAASGISLDDDKVYLLKGGALKPVSAAMLAAAVMAEAFGRTAVAEITGNEVFAVKNGNTRGTITVEALLEYLEENMTVDADLDVSELDAVSAPLETTDLLLVSRGGDNKKLTIANLRDWCLGAFAAYVGSLTAAASVGASDVIYLVQGGTAKKATISQLVTWIAAGNVSGPDTTSENYVPQWDATTRTLKNGVALTTSVAAEPSGTKIPTEGAVRTAIDAAGDVKGPSSTTAGKVPTWDSTAKKLTDGLSVQTEVRNVQTASNDAVPTEKAVRDALDANGGVGGPSVTSENYVPQWSATTKTLKNGLSVQTEVRGSAATSDTALPTEKAVRDAVDGFVSVPPSHAEDAIPTWGAGSELKAGKSVVNVLGTNGSNDNIPTEKAVRDALPGAASALQAGLMSAADKQKLDGLADTGSVPEIAADLGDYDTVIVRKGGTTYRKSLLSRFWTYIYNKLSTVRIDQFADCVDEENGNASTTAHGLLKKLDGNQEHFLRGDGEWETPAGAADFTGDSGSGGTHGLVPAPASGDAEGNKFLNASGAWTVPPSAAGVDIPGADAIDALASADGFYVYDLSEGDYVRVSAAQVAAFVNGLTRYDTVFIPAGAFAPSLTGGAEASSLKFTSNTHDVLAFPGDEDSFAEFNLQMPDGWDGNAVKAKILWTCNSASGENGQTVAFKIGAAAFAEGDPITAGAAASATVSVTDAMLAANQLHTTAASAAIAPLPDGELPVPTDARRLLHFALGRDVSEGTLAQPVQVLGVVVQFGRTATATQW